VASASLWSALLSCYQLLIGMAYFSGLGSGLGHSRLGTSIENIFNEHSKSSGNKNIKLQECAVMAINFFRASS
jgi:hypothetical protein